MPGRCSRKRGMQVKGVYRRPDERGGKDAIGDVWLIVHRYIEGRVQ